MLKIFELAMEGKKDRVEVQDLLEDLDPYVNEDQLFEGYLGLKPIIQRVQSKIDNQVGGAVLV